jgi:hypothetical protein
MMKRSMRCALALALAAWSCGDDDGGSTKPTGPDAGGGDDAARPGLDAAPQDAAPDAKLDAAPPAFNNAFAVRGRLISAPGDKRAKAGGDAAVEHAVSHVMAVNPSAANPVRYLQPVAADGSFAIGVDLATPWVIVLVDSSATGRDMIVGVFRSSAFGLDSIAATRPGMLELGDVTVDEAGTARATVASANLLSALGLSEAAATLLGELDDISLRYVNPDIDGNGKIDVAEGVSYGLDFHLRYNMSDSTGNVGLDDLLNHFADPATTRATYNLGSAIALWAPGKFGATTAADYRIRFPTTSGTFSAPPLMGSYSANVWIEDDAAFYTSAGTDSLGISFDLTQPFPVGEYDFQVKDTQLTFAGVRTHTLAELNASENLLIPFLKLNPVDTSCTGWSCAATGFDYQWMRKSASSWVPATAEEVALLVPMQGGYISFQLGPTSDKRLGYTIPGTPVTGTIPFAMPQNTMNVTPAELATLTLSQICHLGVSYDDTLGMRIFQGWETASACNVP